MTQQGREADDYCYIILKKDVIEYNQIQNKMFKEVFQLFAILEALVMSHSCKTNDN